MGCFHFLRTGKSGRNMPGKKSLFYSIDVFVAIPIIIIGLVVFLSYSYEAPKKEQSSYYLNDLMDFISSAKVGSLSELDYNYIKSYKENGLIDPSNTIGQQMGEMYYLNTTRLKYMPLNETLWNFTEDVLSPLLSDRYNYRLLLFYDYDNDMFVEVYSKNSALAPLKSKDEKNATYLGVSRSIVVGNYNYSNFYGPYVLELRIWQ